MKSLRLLGRLIVLALAIYGLWKILPREDPVVDVFYPADFASGPDGIVGFPSWNARSAREVMAGGSESEHQTSGGLLIAIAADKADTLIESIAEKTETIRDIVNKTEILSFNASIEAAQSGHG